ncbi:Asp-tRNA(Asn)/Glu-tRNA(Gln) amidotransferase subunit GatC [Candidatus Dojkabacteria bacterium]|nr:Asp-tRNA(Asn)/Glu-tRNA(Gln) amidotransferase subunit GatC [Candidatus Dojkabacteria bacterium]
MKVDKDFIKHIANLAKIRLSKEQIDKFTPQMKTILDSADVLQNFDSEKIPQKRYNTLEFEQLRDDKPAASQSQEEALRNAPYNEKGFVKVPGGVIDN